MGFNSAFKGLMTFCQPYQVSEKQIQQVTRKLSTADKYYIGTVIRRREKKNEWK